MNYDNNIQLFDRLILLGKLTINSKEEYEKIKGTDKYNLKVFPYTFFTDKEMMEKEKLSKEFFQHKSEYYRLESSLTKTQKTSFKDYSSGKIDVEKIYSSLNYRDDSFGIGFYVYLTIWLIAYIVSFLIGTATIAALLFFVFTFIAVIVIDILNINKKRKRRILNKNIKA